MVRGDVWHNSSNPNMFVYDFRTSHINFIQNEHVKLNETYKNTQGRFKANLSNVMDVFGRLNSLHETLNTICKQYNNSYKDLYNS